jgi:competence protein ComEA
MHTTKGLVLLLIATLGLSPLAWAQPVNINQASADEISQALSNIGPKKAQAIVAYRTAHGPFKSVEALSSVQGIGEKTIQRNSEDIRLK